MRKFFLNVCKILCAVSVLIFSFSFAGCKSEIDRYDANISELRTGIYVAESANMRVTAITGRRENPFVLDGYSDAKQDFTVITMVPSVFSAGRDYTFDVQFGGKTYEGAFLPHPFAETLSCDIPVKCDDASIALRILWVGGEESFALTSPVSAEILSPEKALNIAMNKLSDRIGELKSGSRLHAEIFVRLTENPIDNTGGYFWYVAFVGENQETYAVLLGCETGEVAAIRN